MTHDSRRTRFPLLARPVSDASVRAVIPLARNISAIDNKVNLFLLGAPTARERLGTPSREKEGDGKRSPGCFSNGRARWPRTAQGAAIGLVRPLRAGDDDAEVGRASCRERVCMYVSITVVADSLK